ncbi:hypothetical protein NVV99_25990 [Rhodococcus sp. PAE-6]|nr:hypothetical protein [Rhodococcus sp. PAE-6]MCT7294341.1 hypothetical protein [Rhodococcus sp. PAE-6]
MGGHRGGRSAPESAPEHRSLVVPTGQGVTDERPLLPSEQNGEIARL